MIFVSNFFIFFAKSNIREGKKKEERNIRNITRKKRQEKKRLTRLDCQKVKMTCRIRFFVIYIYEEHFYRVSHLFHTITPCTTSLSIYIKFWLISLF